MPLPTTLTLATIAALLPAFALGAGRRTTLAGQAHGRAILKAIVADGHHLFAFFETGDDLDLFALEKAEFDRNSTHLAVFDQENVVLVGF